MADQELQELDPADVEVSPPPAPDPEVMAALARKHGLEMGDAPWLQDLIARYDLTPPPGAG